MYFFIINFNKNFKIMKKIAVCLAEGFEEVEALSAVDLLRRGGHEVIMVSMKDDLLVSGAHGISVKADQFYRAVNFDEIDMIVLPGGMPGTTNLENHEELKALLKKFNEEKKMIGAICAAPMILGHLNILKGKNAVCYPGMGKELIGANVKKKDVVVDGHIITSRGVGTALEFALTIVKCLDGREKAEKLAKEIVYKK